MKESLNQALKQFYNDETISLIQNGYQKRTVTFRVNALKSSPRNVELVLQENNIPYKKVNWFDAYLTPFTEDSLRELSVYERGEIYLQSLSSMIPPLVLGAKEGESVLDMTAAPGGKTAQISALSGGKALLTACEKDKIRFERLKYNCEKQGVPRLTLMQMDALKLDDFFCFDKILLDAPCSGSGTYLSCDQNDFSEKLLIRCVNLQKQLLKKAWKLLKKGGELVYSTCSVLPCENDDIVSVLEGEKCCKFVQIENVFGAQTLPSKHGSLLIRPDKQYEGFYICKIKKIG